MISRDFGDFSSSFNAVSNQNYFSEFLFFEVNDDDDFFTKLVKKEVNTSSINKDSIINFVGNKSKASNLINSLLHSSSINFNYVKTWINIVDKKLVLKVKDVAPFKIDKNNTNVIKYEIDEKDDDLMKLIKTEINNHYVTIDTFYKKLKDLEKAYNTIHSLKRSHSIQYDTALIILDCLNKTLKVEIV